MNNEKAVMNQDIREKVSRYGITYRAAAKKAGVSREWMSRMLSKPLSMENRCLIIDSIFEVSEEKNETI